MTEQIADQVQGGTTFTHPTQPAGVWAIVDLDAGESISMVFATEIEALRKLNGRGYGRVRFVEFGKDLHDMDTEESRLTELRQKLSESISERTDSETR